MEVFRIPWSLAIRNARSSLLVATIRKIGLCERGERDVSVTVLALLITALDSTLAEFFSTYTRSVRRVK